MALFSINTMTMTTIISQRKVQGGLGCGIGSWGSDWGIYCTGLSQELNLALGLGGVVQFRAYHEHLGQQRGYWLCQLWGFFRASDSLTLYGGNIWQMFLEQH